MFIYLNVENGTDDFHKISYFRKFIKQKIPSKSRSYRYCFSMQTVHGSFPILIVGIIVYPVTSNYLGRHDTVCGDVIYHLTHDSDDNYVSSTQFILYNLLIVGMDGRVEYFPEKHLKWHLYASNTR